MSGTGDHHRVGDDAPAWRLHGRVIEDPPTEQLLEPVTELIEPVEVDEPDDLPQPTRPLRTGRRRAVETPRRGLSLTLCMAILLLAIAVSSRSWHDPNGAGVTAGSTGSATNPSSAPTPAARPLDLGHPYTGTPAAGWADGAAGITVPAPAALGRYTAEQVATALAQVKQVLVAAHLDDAMLLRHDPGAYLDLLAPNTRAQERTAITASTAPDEGGEVTLIAAGFRLLPVPQKVSGAMSVAIDGHGLLLIHTNVVYAYAFAPAAGGQITQPWQIVAVQHVAEDFTVVGGAGYAAGDRGLWVTSSRAYYDSMACTASEHGYLAPAYSEPGHARTQQDPNILYDPGHPMNIAGTCR